MKTATIPSLRVDPALREAAESVLDQGETLSSFVETALRELLIPFGAAGYVALFKIADAANGVIVAVRHQRKEDYH